MYHIQNPLKKISQSVPFLQEAPLRFVYKDQLNRILNHIIRVR